MIILRGKIDFSAQVSLTFKQLEQKIVNLVPLLVKSMEFGKFMIAVRNMLWYELCVYDIKYLVKDRESKLLLLW